MKAEHKRKVYLLGCVSTHEGALARTVQLLPDPLGRWPPGPAQHTHTHTGLGQGSGAAAADLIFPSDFWCTGGFAVAYAPNSASSFVPLLFSRSETCV